MISLSGKTKEKAVEDLLLQNYDQYYRLAYSYVHNEADAEISSRTAHIKLSEAALT